MAPAPFVAIVDAVDRDLPDLREVEVLARVVRASSIAELDDQIDIERAKRAAAAADEAIRASDDAAAEASLRRADARLRAAGQTV